MERRKHFLQQKATEIARAARSEQESLTVYREEMRKCDEANASHKRYEQATSSLVRSQRAAARSFSADFVSRSNALCRHLVSSELSRLRSNCDDERSRVATTLRIDREVARRTRLKSDSELREARREEARRHSREITNRLKKISDDAKLELIHLRERKALNRKLEQVIESDIFSEPSI